MAQVLRDREAQRAAADGPDILSIMVAPTTGTAATVMPTMSAPPLATNPSMTVITSIAASSATAAASNNSDNNLSLAAKAGIGAGVAVLCSFFIITGFFFYWQRRYARKQRIQGRVNRKPPAQTTQRRNIEYDRVLPPLPQHKRAESSIFSLPEFNLEDIILPEIRVSRFVPFGEEERHLLKPEKAAGT